MAKRPKRGFREYVKNPELFQEEAQEIDRADASPAPGDDRLGTLIAGMYLSRPEYEDLQRLRKAGIQITDDGQAGADAYISCRMQWDHHIASLAPSMAYSMEEIDAAIRENAEA